MPFNFLYASPAVYTYLEWSHSLKAYVGDLRPDYLCFDFLKGETGETLIFWGNHLS